MHRQILALLIISSVAAITQAQTQIGQNLYPPDRGTLFGSDVAISGDLLAIGAPNNNVIANSAGAVHTYRWTGTTWTRTETIYGFTSPGQAGGDLEMEGTRLAFGSRYDDTRSRRAGSVRIYDYDGSRWQQVGNSIFGQADNENLGDDISLDGNRVAAAAPRASGPNSDEYGKVLVYELDGAAWRTVGQPIYGTRNMPNYGWAIALDDDRLAISSVSFGSAGRSSVTTYRLDGATWLQTGDTLKPPSTRNVSFGAEVQIDGELMVIGSSPHSSDSIFTGELYTYRWNGATWDALATVILPVIPNHFIGGYFSLSGTSLAVSNHPSDFQSPGYIQLYSLVNERWEPTGDPLPGRGTGDRFAVGIDLDGTRLATGSPNSGGNGQLSGEGRVFDVSDLLTTGVASPALRTFTLSPNPTTGFVAIRHMDNAAAQRYRVSSLLGAPLLEGSLAPGQSELDLHSLPAGTYTLTLTENGVPTGYAFIVKL